MTALTERTCQQCGRAPWGDESFCGQCGARLERSSVGAPQEISLGAEGSQTPTSDVNADSNRPLRVLLGIAAALILGFIALTALGSLGDDAPGGGNAASEPAEAQTPTSEATATAKPTTTTVATPAPGTISNRTATTLDAPDVPEELDDTDAHTGDEVDDVDDDRVSTITDWSRFTDLYDGEGVLAVKTRSNQVTLVDLATGRTTAYDTPSAPGAFGPTTGVHATTTGHVSSRLGAIVITPWDGSADIEIPLTDDDSFRPTILTVSDEQIVSFRAELFRPDDLKAYVHGISDRSTTTVELPATSIEFLYGWSPSGRNPVLLQSGTALHRFTLDDGWTRLGEGKLIARSSRGVLLEVCEPVDRELNCTYSTVNFDGETTAAHPDVADLSFFGAVLSDDLNWAATIEFDEDTVDGEIAGLVFVELPTGRSRKLDLTDGSPTFLPQGVWLPDSSLFAYIANGEPLQIVDAATGAVTEIAETPWSERRSSDEPAAARLLMMDFPERAPESG